MVRPLARMHRIDRWLVYRWSRKRNKTKTIGESSFVLIVSNGKEGKSERERKLFFFLLLLGERVGSWWWYQRSYTWVMWFHIWTVYPHKSRGRRGSSLDKDLAARYSQLPPHNSPFSWLHFLSPERTHLKGFSLKRPEWLALLIGIKGASRGHNSPFMVLMAGSWEARMDSREPPSNWCSRKWCSRGKGLAQDSHYCPKTQGHVF